MTARLLWVLAVCTCAASAVASAGQPQQGARAASVSPVFAARVQAYVALQKKLEASLAAEPPSVELDKIAGRQSALAKSIAVARRDVRQGNIFTPEVAGQFRTIIRDAFRRPDGVDIRRTIQEGDPEQAVVLYVNAVYSEDIPLGTMSPTLLGRLPALPAELAYRVIGRALALKDVKTNVIVDFIPDLIPRLR